MCHGCFVVSIDRNFAMVALPLQKNKKHKNLNDTTGEGSNTEVGNPSFLDQSLVVKFYIHL
jgi:hypothetical protein